MPMISLGIRERLFSLLCPLLNSHVHKWTESHDDRYIFLEDAPEY